MGIATIPNVYGTREQTQGFMHASQIFHQLDCIPSLELSLLGMKGCLLYPPGPGLIYEVSLNQKPKVFPGAPKLHRKGLFLSTLSCGETPRVGRGNEEKQGFPMVGQTAQRVASQHKPPTPCFLLCPSGTHPAPASPGSSQVLPHQLLEDQLSLPAQHPEGP